MPLWGHAALLGALLAVVATSIGTRSAFVTDESFVQIQLDVLERTGEWTLPHPLPSVDPDGDDFPLHGASQYSDSYTLYGKHPALIYLYRPFHSAFGTGGLVAVSIAGTIAAAFLAGLLAERFRRGSGALTLWLVGVASPLFFDAFVVHAHTVAAATAVLAAWAATHALDDRRLRWFGVAVAATLATALLRTEGTLFAAALGVAVLGSGIVRRRGRLVALGGAVAAAGAAAVLIDRWWSDAVTSGSFLGSVATESSGSSYLESRVSSIAYTLVMPGYRGITPAEALTAVGALLVIVGVVLVHRRPGDQGAIAVPVLGAALLVVRAGLEWGPVPGLGLAFCIGVSGLLLASRSLLAQDGVRLVLGAAALFGAGVAVTQYESGGHTEWGGRYFALAVPLLGAVAAPALLEAWAGWDRRRARVVQGALVAAALGLTVLSVTTLRYSHDRNRERSDNVLAAAAALAPASDGGPTVVVTEDDQVPRLARGRYDEVRFLRVLPADVEGALERLAAAGFEELLVVSLDPERTLDALGPYEAVGPVQPHARQWTDDGGLIAVRLEAP